MAHSQQSRIAVKEYQTDAGTLHLKDLFCDAQRFGGCYKNVSV